MPTSLITPWVLALAEEDAIAPTAWLVPAGIARERLLALLTAQLPDALTAPPAAGSPGGCDWRDAPSAASALVGTALQALAARKVVTPLPLVVFRRQDALAAPLWDDAERLLAAAPCAGAAQRTERPR
ncbi:MAG: hypothetical protein NZ761_07305 [Dehalococcoidia bacterium]|nr:hypothetical protein [Dehalococcoidia bacterium]